MTQEEKQLLIKDLCARLPYGVICHYNCAIPIERAYLHKTNCKDVLRGIVPTPDKHIGFMVGFDKIDALEGDIKPYLRPMSSMTEEEKEEFENLLEGIVDGVERWDKPDLCDDYDWLNKNHFDYRGLIEKGLALEAPEGMYEID